MLFGPPGHAYVYFIYGMYECLNFVAEEEGKAGCVLIRALEPVAGIHDHAPPAGPAAKREDLAIGTGKLTLALGITRKQNGADLTAALCMCSRNASETHFRYGVSQNRHHALRRLAAALLDPRQSVRQPVALPWYRLEVAIGSGTAKSPIINGGVHFAATTH